MTSVEEHLRQVVRDMATVGAKYAVVGGLAVSARAEPRMTRDADLAVSIQDDGEAERLVFALQTLGYRIFAAVEHDGTGRLSTVRLEVGATAVVDLLFASTGIEPDIVERATPLSILPGLVVPVAGVGDLIAMKLLARDDRHRPADADDLRALREVATPADWRTARVAVNAIGQRGFGRGRDLVAALDALITHGAFGPE